MKYTSTQNVNPENKKSMESKFNAQMVSPLYKEEKRTFIINVISHVHVYSHTWISWQVIYTDGKCNPNTKMMLQSQLTGCERSAMAYAELIVQVHTRGAVRKRYCHSEMLWYHVLRVQNASKGDNDLKPII